MISYAAGEVVIDAPRDREGTFDPQILKKWQRQLSDVGEVVLSLYAKRLTNREISAHFDQIYGASISKKAISRITDKVIDEMNERTSLKGSKMVYKRLACRFGCDQQYAA